MKTLNQLDGDLIIQLLYNDALCRLILLQIFRKLGSPMNDSNVRMPVGVVTNDKELKKLQQEMLKYEIFYFLEKSMNQNCKRNNSNLHQKK